MSDSTQTEVLAYSVQGVQTALGGAGRTKVYSLISAGRLRAVKCGGRTLIPADSLREYVASLPAAAIGARHQEAA